MDVFLTNLIFFYNNPKKQEGCHCRKKFDIGPIRKMFESLLFRNYKADQIQTDHWYAWSCYKLAFVL